MIYRSFKLFTWDLGIFNQALWNTLHGKFLYYTAEPYYTRTGCFLGTHFSPIILFVLPFYAIYPSGENLLVISTFIVAIGALPVYEMAFFFLKNEKLAAMFGILYLLYPPLQGVTLTGFSPEPFMVTLFLFILCYLVKADFKKLALVFPLGLITHEAAAPVIAFIGIYGMLYYKSIKSRGFQVSLLISAACVPYYFLAEYARFFFGWTGQPSFWREWAIIGAVTTSDLPLKIFLNPLGAINSLVFDWVTKLVFLILLLLPVLFIPLLSLKGLIPAFPYLTIALLSSYRLYYSLEGHYTAFIAPFIFLSFLQGVAEIQKKPHFKISVLKLTKLAFLITIITSLIVLFPSACFQYLSFNTVGDHIDVLRSFISHIPQNASILTQSNVFPHVSGRFEAYTIAPPTWNSEYEKAGKEVLQNLSRLNIEYVLLDFASDPPYSSTAYFIYIHFITKNENKYGLCNAKNGVVLFCLNP